MSLPDNLPSADSPGCRSDALCSARATLQLGHTGDYPGYPCARINDHSVGDEQWRLLLSLFAVPGDGVGYERRRKLFDLLGAKPIPGSLETSLLEGVMEVRFLPNTKLSGSEGAKDI